MPSSPSWATNSRVRRVMLGNKSRDTLPELAVRRMLHRQGYRYRVNFRPLASIRTTADIVFTRQHLAVFIDGCFWHGCPTHYVRSKSNVAYWNVKIENTRARDALRSAELTQAGWTVLRFCATDEP